jgi:hypothetical protein
MIFEELHTGTTNSDGIYLSLDTSEGSESFGHWLLECGIFLP